MRRLEYDGAVGNGPLCPADRSVAVGLGVARPRRRSRTSAPARPYALVTRAAEDGALRRVASIVSLLALDLGGLVARRLRRARPPRAAVRAEAAALGRPLARGRREWLPFLALIMVLVFWRAGLYAPREVREGPAGSSPRSSVVAALALAFGIGTGHEFGTFGIFPTALVLDAVAIALLRWSYEASRGNLLRIAGVRRARCSSASRREVAHLHAALGSSRGGIDYEFVGDARARRATSGSCSRRSSSTS